MKVWDIIKRLMRLYKLNHYDAVQIMGFCLTARESQKREQDVLLALCEDGQELSGGWTTIKAFLRGLTKATTNCGEITKCVQKANESFADLEERFRTVVMRHSGLLGFDDDEGLDGSRNGAILHQLMQSIATELRNRYVATNAR